MKEKSHNISLPFRNQAQKKPQSIAVVHQKLTGYKTITFAELESESNRLANGFTKMGIARGTRTLLMVRPGIPFVAVTFALFKAGAIPVFIDPGMGIRNLLNSIRQVECQAFIGVPPAHIIRLILRKYFKTIKHLVTIGTKLFWGGTTYGTLISSNDNEFEPVYAKPDETAAIVFTTGSTGPPKGVVYTHGMYRGQLKIIRESYGISEEDVDLSAFPLFSLFAVALGMKAVIPNMNPSKPAKVKPQNIVKAVNNQAVTFTFGSPAIWNRVSRYCMENAIKLPTLKNVLMAGAPVPVEIHDNLLNKILSEGAQTHTPYGATEALPISDMTGSEVLEETGELTANGYGICVGRPIKDVEIRIIKINDNPIHAWNGSLVLSTMEKGEIVVKGPVVTREYYGLPEHNHLGKIQDDETVWHRMGDIGYFDQKGRLWFCGRKDHRVMTEKGTLFTVCCEAIFNRHPGVYRSALVGIGNRSNQRPVIIVELKKEKILPGRKKIKKELIELGATSPLTSSIKDVLFHRGFPTDIRHNAKISREILKVWAEGKLFPQVQKP